MRVIIVGGGKIGAYLARELRKHKHVVVVIELDPDRARKVDAETDVLVLIGDGTDLTLLAEAGIDKADWLLAVTGQDENNLVACQLARTSGRCPNVLARLNDPRNRATFDALGVPIVGVTDLIGQIMSRELDLDALKRIAVLGRGTVSLVEVDLPADVTVRSVGDLSIPQPAVLVVIQRGSTVLVPGAASEIEPMDRVVAVTLVELEDDLRDALLGRQEGSRG